MKVLARFSEASILLFMTVFVSVSYFRARSVRADLAKLQEQTGLSLVSVQNRSIQAVVFSCGKALKVRDLRGGIGTVSPDGSEAAFVSDTTSFDLPISRTHGTDVREYRNVRMPNDNSMCWSHDK